MLLARITIATAFEQFDLQEENRRLLALTLKQNEDLTAVMHSLEAKVQAVAELAPLVKLLPSGLARSVFEDAIAKKLGVSLAKVKTDILRARTALAAIIARSGARHETLSA